MLKSLLRNGTAFLRTRTHPLAYFLSSGTLLAVPNRTEMLYEGAFTALFKAQRGMSVPVRCGCLM